MKRTIRLSALGLAVIAILMTGCGTPNPNPATPHANTGYIDFYTDSNMELSWQVMRFDTQKAELEDVFSKFDPVEGTILRIASPLGRQRYQVWIVNRVTEGPLFVDVQVEEGKVIPVHVTLTPAGTTTVDRKVYGFRPSAKGYGRGTKIVTSQDEVFRLGLTSETAKPYQTKERMPYWSAEVK